MQSTSQILTNTFCKSCGIDKFEYIYVLWFHGLWLKIRGDERFVIVRVPISDSPYRLRRLSKYLYLTLRRLKNATHHNAGAVRH